MTQLIHRFVEFIPDSLDEGVIYLSIACGTVVHRCCCGCGREVVTPLTPTDWKLIFDGQTVSLYPSIGNWSFPCRAHYWITRNRVDWAADWPDWCIATARYEDQEMKDKFFGSREEEQSGEANEQGAKTRAGFWSRLLRKW